MDDEKQVAFSENFGPLEITGSSNPAAGTQFQRQSNLDILTGEPIPPDVLDKDAERAREKLDAWLLNLRTPAADARKTAQITT